MTGEPGGDRFPRAERAEEDECDDEDEVRRERGADDGGGCELELGVGFGAGDLGGARRKRDARNGNRARVRVFK